MGKIVKFSLFVAITSAICYYFYPNLQQTTLIHLNNYIQKFWSDQAQEPISSSSESSCLDEGERLFTASELLKYSGSGDSLGLCLGFLGVVYDVSKGAQHYKPGGSYAFFSGKDATRAYLTGEFTENGLIDDLEGVDVESFGGIKTWVELYESEYKRVGRIVGTYYDSQGCPTEKLRWVHKMIAENEAKESDESDEAITFPPCNTEWNQELGKGRVWCSARSGGVNRDWVGVPRQLYSPGKNSFRCACIKNFGSPSTSNIEYANDEDESSNQIDVGDLNNPRLKEYKGCDPKSFECKIND